MSRGYEQQNGAMHSGSTSHKEKRGVSQIVTTETRMMQSNSYTKQAICLVQARIKHLLTKFIESELFYIFYMITN